MGDTRTSYERMLAGEPIAGPDWDLIGMQVEARKRLNQFNAIPDGDEEGRTALLKEVLGSYGGGIVVPPVYWEYGKHIHLGVCFINFDCVFLDGAPITIGDNTLVGPRVQFLTASHPIRSSDRNRFDPKTGQWLGSWLLHKPITVGKGCWLGAAAIICGGVAIGDRTTIGAGSVVTRSIPADVFAAGNPCRVIRKIE